MSASGTPVVSCPDRLGLQRWRDADPSLVEADEIARHVDGCTGCQAALATLDEEQGAIATLLDGEDAAASRVAPHQLASVRARLLPRRPRRSSRRRFAMVASALAATIVAAVAVLDRQPLEASPDWVLTESQVRARAWRTQPGMTRVEVYETHSQMPGKAPVRRRQVTWFSTVPGAERTTTRLLEPSGALVSASWTQTDGREAAFDTREGPRLTLDPPVAEVQALLPTLSADDAAAVRFWLGTKTWRVRPQEQAASQATMLSGAAEYTRGIGVLQGEPRLQRDGATYTLTFTVAPPPRPGHEGERLTIEDTFAAASLMHERRVVRRTTREGVLVDEGSRQLVSRGDANPATLAALMAEMDRPPAHWRLRRRSPADFLAQSRQMWATFKATLPPPVVAPATPPPTQ